MLSKLPGWVIAQAAQQIADAFEGAGVRYAIGGALALAVAGVPRGTADVDVNVFVDHDRVGEVVDVLAQLRRFRAR